MRRVFSFGRVPAGVLLRLHHRPEWRPQAPLRQPRDRVLPRLLSARSASHANVCAPSPPAAASRFAARRTACASEAHGTHTAHLTHFLTLTADA